MSRPRLSVRSRGEPYLRGGDREWHCLLNGSALGGERERLRCHLPELRGSLAALAILRIWLHGRHTIWRRMGDHQRWDVHPRRSRSWCVTCEAGRCQCDTTRQSQRWCAAQGGQEWQLANGKWQMANGKLQVANGRRDDVVPHVADQRRVWCAIWDVGGGGEGG